jgi:hypothetical protein
VEKMEVRRGLLHWITVQSAQHTLQLHAVDAIQGVTKRCGHIFTTSSMYQNKKEVYINMCPQTLNLLCYSWKSTL